MQYVTTIEFDGRKAVLNSYSDAYLRAYGTESIERQISAWSRRFPRCTVRCEMLPTSVVQELVAVRGTNGAYLLGEASTKAA